MQLAKGTRLGPYEIVSPLGVGGMGEVYRARDTRLGREVAIKILPAAMSDDPKLLARFQREAKAISTLNHPNICVLHDIGEIPSERERAPLRYIVMEYLEGETLEHRLKRGPLPIDEVLRYAIQIADALDKAHRKHILHRDLKPSNVMITRSGARLFDFGLAKFLRPGSPAQWQLGRSSEGDVRLFSEATTPQKSITAEGSVIGTLEYMAPEQVEGKDVDARTDIFSFGICLFQMITGRRPFQGTSRASVMAAILEQDPEPISKLQPACPSSLEWLVKECLEKDPDDRIQTAHDVMLELRRIAEQDRSTEATSVRATPSRAFFYMIGAIIAVLACVGVVLFVRHFTGLKTRGIRRYSISLPSNAPLAAGTFEKFAVAPDGTRMAYVGAEHPSRLYLYSVDSNETKALPDTEGARGPFFSPDGQWVGFYTLDRGLEKIAVTKGTPTVLNAERDVRGATWGTDGTIVFAESVSLLLKIPASGGRAETVAACDPQANVRWPSFLPGGEYVLYTVNDYGADYDKARLVVRSLKTGQTKTVLNGATYGRYVNPGYLAYLHGQTLFAVPFKLRKMEVTDSPIPLASDIDSYFASGLAHLAVAADGSIFYLPRDVAQTERDLVWVDRLGSATPVIAERRAYEDPKLSPDGQRLVVTIGTRPRLDLWLYDLDRGTWTRLTNEATNETAVWSPDGRNIAFASNRNGGFDLYIMSSDGSAPPRQITSRRSWDFPRSWSPDGKVLTVFEQYRATLRDIFVVSPQERSVPTPLLSTSADEDQAVFSPDGRWIAYQSNQSGRNEIYVQSYPQGGRKWLVSTSGGTNPTWRRDGAELFYRNGNKMMSVDVHLGSEFITSKPRVLFRGEFEDAYDVTPDGRRFIMVKRPPQSPRTQINVVLGAFDHLK